MNVIFPFRKKNCLSVSFVAFTRNLLIIWAVPHKAENVGGRYFLGRETLRCKFLSEGRETRIVAVRHDAIFIAAARSTFEQCDSTRHEIYSIFQLESALGKLTFILDLHDIVCVRVFFGNSNSFVLRGFQDEDGEEGEGVYGFC